MPKSMVLRVQSKGGRFPVNSLYPESTLFELQQTLSEKTQLPPEVQKILLGFPPREIESYNPSSTLLSLRIKSGETLILEERSSCSIKRGVSEHPKTKGEPSAPNELLTGSTDVESRCSPGPTSTMGSYFSYSQRPPIEGKLIRKVVPADNSCLFRSISILLCRGVETNGNLRELVAGLIASNPNKYDSALLGQSNRTYVQWLQKKESWGGAIELTVLSEHFKVELDVVDIQTQRIDRFGEDRNYPTCAFLLYDGIHYDPLVRKLGSETSLQGIFPVDDDSVVMEALKIAKDAFQERQFTDMSHFSLRCLVCNTALRGQNDAMVHARTTGHSNFGEISS